MIKPWKEEIAIKFGGFKRIKIWMKEEIEPFIGCECFHPMMIRRKRIHRMDSFQISLARGIKGNHDWSIINFLQPSLVHETKNIN